VKTLLLTKKDAKKITSIGTGNQARMQIRAIYEIMKIEEIHAWDNSPESLSAYKRDIESEFGIPVVMASSKKAAVEQADILITTTRGKGSLVEADWVKPGTHIVAIGTDQRGKQELDPEIFRNAKVVVDSLSQCIEKGETWHPLEASGAKPIVAKTDPAFLMDAGRLGGRGHGYRSPGRWRLDLGNCDRHQGNQTIGACHRR